VEEAGVAFTVVLAGTDEETVVLAGTDEEAVVVFDAGDAAVLVGADEEGVGVFVGCGEGAGAVLTGGVTGLVFVGTGAGFVWV